MLVKEPESKRLLERRRRRWEDDSRMDLRVIGWDVVDCTHLIQNRGKWPALMNHKS